MLSPITSRAINGLETDKIDIERLEIVPAFSVIEHQVFSVQSAR